MEQQQEDTFLNSIYNFLFTPEAPKEKSAQEKIIEAKKNLSTIIDGFENDITILSIDQETNNRALKSAAAKLNKEDVTQYARKSVELKRKKTKLIKDSSMVSSYMDTIQDVETGAKINSSLKNVSESLATFPGLADISSIESSVSNFMQQAERMKEMNSVLREMNTYSEEEDLSEEMEVKELIEREMQVSHLNLASSLPSPQKKSNVVEKREVTSKNVQNIQNKK